MLAHYLMVLVFAILSLSLLIMEMMKMKLYHIILNVVIMKKKNQKD